ncbi:MAG: SurA N-terminal domain-containing protein [Myxococcaceae bacterium]
MSRSIDSRRFFSYLFIVAIAVVFALQFGPGSRGCEVQTPTTQSYAAKVNGKEIPLTEFAQQYGFQIQYARRRLDEMAQRFGGQVDLDAIVRQQVSPQMVLDQLIDVELLSQAAEKHGIVASDPEIRKIIRGNPDFQREGQFDRDRYNNILSQYYKKTPTDYEADIRRRLSAAKFEEVMRASASVSDEEVVARFRRDNDKANLRFVRFLPAMFAESVPAPSSAELARWQAAHTADIQREYDVNRVAYRTPEQVHARHILLKVAAATTIEKKDQVRARLAEIKRDLDKGGDFADAAKAHSEDEATRSAGGDLGLRARGPDVPRPVFDAAFAQEPGQVSDIVESPVGFHLVKTEAKQAAVEKSLADVSSDIAQRLFRKEKALARAKASAERTLAAAKGGKSLADLHRPKKDAPPISPYEAESAPTALETGSFSVGSPQLPKIGLAEALSLHVTQTRSPGLLSTLYAAGDGFVVAQVLERNQPNDAELSASMNELREQARYAKQTELTESLRTALRKAAKVETQADALTQVVDGARG